MYNQYFGLQRAPFKITPDTRMFFRGAGRGEILDALVYAVTSGEGIIKVVGEVGTGKTMICRMLEDCMPPNVELVYLANPSLSPEDILHAVALEMRIPLDPAVNRQELERKGIIGRERRLNWIEILREAFPRAKAATAALFDSDAVALRTRLPGRDRGVRDLCLGDAVEPGIATRG